MMSNIAPRFVTAGGLVVAAWIVLTPAADAPAEDPRPPDVAHIDARIIAKTFVARELLAGRLSVAEATAVFTWLERREPAPSLRDCEPVGTSPRSMAQVTVNWAAMATRGRLAEPHVRQAVGRVQDELDRIGRTPGRLDLPAVNETGCNDLIHWAAGVENQARGGPVHLHPAPRISLVRDGR